MSSRHSVDERSGRPSITSISAARPTDNLKSGVNKASFYDPEINRSYGMMAAHYGVGVLPARPGRPKDKAKVESGVRLAQTYILGRLRHQTFFSLAERNVAIRTVLGDLNGRPRSSSIPCRMP